MADYVKTFPCPECKKEASGRGHLCHPNNKELPYVCEFCKKSTDDPRHVCSTMVDNFEYVCRKCGRVAVYGSLLCEPELINMD